MSGETARLRLAELPEGQAMNAAEINTVLGQLDALVDCCLKGVFVDASPATASDGDVYLVGGSPSGDWGAEFTYKLACRRDGAWVPVIPFDGLRAFVPAADTFLVYAAGVWTDWNALIGAAEGSIASAATCDIGAAGSLFVAVTGTTTITSLGSGANCLRFLRFAGALTLTHDATCLVLPGAANIVTAAGDTALFSSDGSGHWRCRHYSRADGQPVAAHLTPASVTASCFQGKLVGSVANGGTLAGVNNGAGGGLFVIHGGIAFNEFIDLVMFFNFGGTAVVTSVGLGSCPARTYALGGAGLDLTLTSGGAAGTYQIGVTVLAMA